MSNDSAKRAVVRVYLVDDHPVVSEGLARLIDREKDLEVCGTGADVVQALDEIQELKPDVAVIDLGLGTESGLALIARLKTACPSVRTFVLSMHEERIYAERALQAGALGYIMKEEASGRVLDAIRIVANGKIYLSSAMTEMMVARATHGPSNSGPRSVSLLSDRELETLRLTGLGQTTSEIAEQLHLSIKTVENYKERIKNKLGLRNAQELARYAFDFSANRIVP